MLLSYNIHLDIQENEQKRIPAKGPFVAICGKRRSAIDDLMMNCILKDTGASLSLYQPKDIRRRYADMGQRWQKIKNREVSPLQALKPTDLLVAPVEEGHSLLAYLDYVGSTWWKIRKRRRLKKLFKVTEERGISIVPIHLQYQENYPISIKENQDIPYLEQPLHIKARIGHPISSDKQKAFKSKRRFRKFLQSKIYALGSALEVQRFYLQEDIRPDQQEAIIDPIPQSDLEADIQQLTFHHLIAQQGPFDIFISKAKDIPHIIKEIGPLLER